MSCENEGNSRRMSYHLQAFIFKNFSIWLTDEAWKIEEMTFNLHTW